MAVHIADSALATAKSATNLAVATRCLSVHVSRRHHGRCHAVCWSKWMVPTTDWTFGRKKLATRQTFMVAGGGKAYSCPHGLVQVGIRDHFLEMKLWGQSFSCGPLLQLEPAARASVLHGNRELAAMLQQHLLIRHRLLGCRGGCGRARHMPTRVQDLLTVWELQRQGKHMPAGAA